MIYEQKMVDGECALVSGLAHLLNTHIYSSKTAGFYEVYAKTGNGRYSTWESFAHAVYAGHARSWHEAVGDFWSGIMMRYTEHGTWPKIRDLFNIGVRHRFTEVPENDAQH
jgi:hypothetical protein